MFLCTFIWSRSAQCSVYITSEMLFAEQKKSKTNKKIQNKQKTKNNKKQTSTQKKSCLPASLYLDLPDPSDLSNLGYWTVEEHLSHPRVPFLTYMSSRIFNLSPGSSCTNLPHSPKLSQKYHNLSTVWGSTMGQVCHAGGTWCLCGSAVQ